MSKTEQKSPGLDVRTVAEVGFIAYIAAKTIRAAASTTTSAILFRRNRKAAKAMA